MSQVRLTRRSLLAALAGVGATSLLSRRSRADTASVPTRVLFFWTQQGTFRPAWAPGGAGGAPGPTETAFTLGPLHQPLVPFQRKLLLLDGLEMVSAGVDPTPASNAHFAGATHSLVAANRAGGALPGARSIDQYIAQAINAAAPVTALPSIELALADQGAAGEAQCSALGPSQWVPFESDPARAFDRLFRNSAANPFGATQQKSVLDLVHDEYAAVLPRLGRDDRQRLSTHADVVRDLERTLSLGAGLACQSPSRADYGALLSQLPYAERYRTRADLMCRLTAAALACDLTRVATLTLDVADSDLIGYTPGLLGTSDSHDLVHKTCGSDGPLHNDPTAAGVITKMHVTHHEVFAKLLGYLDAIPEGPPGETLLDHCVVLYCGQIGDGTHDLTWLPWLLAGGAGGAVRTGRYLKLPQSGGHGVPHNNLFLSLANLMGVPATTFGNPATCTGPLGALS
jgi:hypothetical protein